MMLHRDLSGFVRTIAIVVIVLLLSGCNIACAGEISESQAKQLALSYISGQTKLPCSVISSITQEFIYDCCSDWYICFNYQEAAEGIDSTTGYPVDSLIL